MVLWSKMERIELDTCAFFANETIVDMVTLRPNPGEGHVRLKTAENGDSILACLPHTSGEIDAIRITEKIVGESKSTRTLSEAL